MDDVTPHGRYPMFLSGNAVESAAHDLAVHDKFTGEVAAHVPLAGPRELEAAIAAAFASRRTVATWPRDARREALLHVVERITQRRDELAQVLCIEVGKAIREARAEVARAIDTFRLSAEEATRVHGEHMALDISPRGRGYEAVWKRMPVGVCAFITPFNFPLNLAAHKVGPALAAGCPFILKPAEKTPLTAAILGEILAETDLPRGSWSILPLDVADVSPLVEDERVALLSFTGSEKVGYALKARAGAKRVVLELGGNAACLVDRAIDLDFVADRLTAAAFAQAGQSCISVQRVYAHGSVYDALKTRLVARAGRLRLGDPRDEATDVGPLVTEAEAQRIERWIAQAAARGAKVLCGGTRRGRFVEPTWLEDVPDDAALACEEAFGPVATLAPVPDMNAAIGRANASRYGLQAGLFTNDLALALRAFDELEVGGVILNDIPGARIDSMPYGGVKRSGLGREGVRFAIEEMTEIRTLVVNRNAPPHS